MADRTATWFLIQHEADLRKREPRNVGIVLEADGEYRSKFFAVDDDWAINGHRLRAHRLTTDVYSAWLDYFRRKLDAGDWGDVVRSQEQRRRGFGIVVGGHIYEERDWTLETDRIYAELVTDVMAAGGDSDAKERLGVILAKAKVPVEPDFETPVRFGDHNEGTIKWDYAYQNGSLHLMTALKLGGWSGIERSQAYFGRATATSQAKSDVNFVAFHDGIPGDIEPDAVLGPLEAVAHVFDMNDVDIVDHVREAMHVA